MQAGTFAHFAARRRQRAAQRQQPEHGAAGVEGGEQGHAAAHQDGQGLRQAGAVERLQQAAEDRQAQELKEKPSIADLVIDGTTVSSRKRALALDFGGYLKGVALDRAAAILRGQGINNALINIGGNVMALGSKEGRKWRVGIQHPRQPGPLATVQLDDGEAIGTSGDYQRYFELDGRRYSHLIDPRTATPVDHTQAVTVLIPAGPKAGTLSDAASKPIFIAGPEHWRAMADQMGTPLVLRVAADGRISVTAALDRRLEYLGDRTNINVVP